MISLEMCQRYGMDSEKELMTAIEELRKMGMPDIAIQAILDRSRSKGESDVYTSRQRKGTKRDGRNGDLSCDQKNHGEV